MSSREELTVGPGQTQNLVLSFDASETFHLFNKTIVTLSWAASSQHQDFRETKLVTRSLFTSGGSEAKGTR